MWPPRPQAPRDPESPEFLFFVMVALIGLTLFYAFGSYRIYRSQKPFYEGLAQAFCDPGTGRTRFVWFPPQFSFSGKFQGKDVHFMSASAGRQMRTHLMIGMPMDHDLKVTRKNFRQQPPALQQLLLPFIRHKGFDFLTARRSAWRSLWDGRPMAFGFGPGIHASLITPDFDLPGLKLEAQLLIQVAESPLI